MQGLSSYCVMSIFLTDTAADVAQQLLHMLVEQRRSFTIPLIASPALTPRRRKARSQRSVLVRSVWKTSSSIILLVRMSPSSRTCQSPSLLARQSLSSVHPDPESLLSSLSSSGSTTRCLVSSDSMALTSRHSTSSGCVPRSAWFPRSLRCSLPRSKETSLTV